MVGVANSTDVVSTSVSRKFMIGQFSTASSNDKFKAYFNYQGSYGGSFNLSHFDVVLTDAVTDKFSIGYNGTVQSVKPAGGSGNSWWGSALYLNVDPTSTFGITLRGEYFDNKKAIVSAPATSIFDLTLSPNIKVGKLIIIPELRFEDAKDKIYVKNDGTSTKGTASFILAAAYSF